MGTSGHFANIFTNSNYQGQVKYITRTGWYIINSEFTGFDNNISSVTTSILNNVRIILFSEPEFGGVELVVENDLPRLPATMDNKCSSIIVELKIERHVQLFESADYGGIEKTLYGMSYPRLREFFPNDRLSSIKVPFGTEVHLYDNEDFGGKRVIIDKDTPFIGSDINDRISSIRIYGSPVAYSDPNFTGRSQVLEFLESYDSQPQGRSRYLRIGDNAIRSLKIPYPWGVQAFQDPNFRGQQTFYRHDVENIAGSISSLKILPTIITSLPLPF